MKYIYIDSLFFLSLFTDYLLCLITARICRLCLRRWRYLAAALLGAVYSVSVFLPGLGFMASRWMELVSAALMGLIAFGGERRIFVLDAAASEAEARRLIAEAAALAPPEPSPHTCRRRQNVR